MDIKTRVIAKRVTKRSAFLRQKEIAQQNIKRVTKAIQKEFE